MQPSALAILPTMSPAARYAVRLLFGIPWIIFGIQHYMYADFVGTLVPAFMPWRVFWAYFTGTAMFVAGLSFIIRWQTQLAAFLLGCLMLLYLLMVHPGMLTNEPQVGQHWTRFMQDIAIMGAAFALAMSEWKALDQNRRFRPRYPRKGPTVLEPTKDTSEALVSKQLRRRPTDGMFGARQAMAKNWGMDAAGLRGWRAWLASARASVIVRYCYALPFIVLGAQHFTHNAFVTAKVPDWALFPHFWDYVIGLALIAASYGILFTSKKRWTACALGTILTALALLQHVPRMITDPHNPGVWTPSMLDFALAAGAFLLAETMD
ncbi:MAG TPA: hypothetical protein VHC96_08310 [Puia sp.]|jgi:uncharacterized membrane protein|nr:hypothetical protein [Puia sp.]